MADFIIKIQEQISLNGVQRGSEVSKTISGINYTDNRILNTSSGSETTIFSLSDTVGAGQSLKLMQVDLLCYLLLILQEVFYQVVTLYLLMGI